MFKNTRRGAAALLVMLATLALLLMSAGVSHASPSTPQSTSNPVGLSGYNISVFARGTSAYTQPDSVEKYGQYIYVGYQNHGKPDGSDHKFSTIVQYTLQGKVEHTYSILGHNDGMRFNPYTHQLWATANEDANAHLYVINPNTGAIKRYDFNQPAPHEGGYDDMAFTNGMAFVAASNPTLNSQGINTAPALGKITLRGNKVIVTPVLYGNATATNTVTNQKVTLNLTDPDSISLDLQGNVVLDSQGDAEIITIHHTGLSNQSVTVVPLGTQVDDSAWVTAHEGRLIVADTAMNVVYSVRYNFTRGTVYTEAPGDSGVAGFIGTVNLTTGTITPVIIGLGSPSGLIFIPEE